jgi:hypothetical protein
MARRRARPPEKILICGQAVKVMYHKEMPEGMEKDDGNYIYDDHEINIDLGATRTPDQILLHEILHAIIGYTGHNEHLTLKQEEGLVSALEQNLMPLIRLKRREQW